MLFELIALALAATQTVTATPVAVPHASPLHVTSSSFGSGFLANRAPTSFKHPGVLVSGAQLDFVKRKVNAGEQPWTDAYNAMLDSDLASLDYTCESRETVECGSYSDPDYGCTQEREDALFSYAMSLAWYIEGKEEYANKAIECMNEWAGTIQEHTNDNAPLQTGWAGASWSRAADIIRHSDAGWSESDVQAFEKMLSDVYLPTVIKGSDSNGNWELVMLEAAIGIAVFTEDTASYTKAMGMLRDRAAAYVYLRADGALPNPPPHSDDDSSDAIVEYWYGQDDFRASGIAQETCRDFDHTGYGLASMSHIAETARHQGDDLWTTDVGQRVRYALDFHAPLQLETEERPDWLCADAGELLLGDDENDGIRIIGEVGYNALAFRGSGFRGGNSSMASTKKLVEQARPADTNRLFLGWETLTHANNPV